MSARLDPQIVSDLIDVLKAVADKLPDDESTLKRLCHQYRLYLASIPDTAEESEKR